MLHRGKFYSEWRVSFAYIGFFFVHIFSVSLVLLSPLFLTFVHSRICLTLFSLSGAVASTVYIFSATSFLFNKNSQHTRRYFVRFFLLFFFQLLLTFSFLAVQLLLELCCCCRCLSCYCYYCYYLYFISI